MEKAPKIELPQKPAEEPEIATWEDEGGSVEMKNRLEMRKDLPVGKWWKIMLKFKDELPSDIQLFTEKGGQNNLTEDELKRYHVFRDKWWLSKFGLNFQDWLRYSKEQFKNKRIKLTENLQNQKRQKIEELHQALKNLDEGEPVDEFRDETRKVVYFDEDNNKYFVEEAGHKKYLGIGDILSDYAWGIKYVPDGEMIEPRYRTLAKKVLVNESRRELEQIHNSELITQKPHRHSAASFVRIWPQLKDSFTMKEGGWL